MRHVAIVQPYVPAYSLAFFDGLVRTLAAEQVVVRVYHSPELAQALSRQDAQSPPWAVSIEAREFSLVGRGIVARRLPPGTRDCDLLILEQALGKSDLSHLYRPRRKHSVAMMGHGHIYSRPTSTLERRLLRHVTGRADWFFGYTTSAIADAVAAGIPAKRVTIFENSTDTAALAAARASVRPHEVQRIRDLYSIGPGPVLLFLGSVDRSKRPDFLVAAMREVWRAEPSARLVVAGEGDSLAILLSAGSGVIALGRLTGDGLAAVAALADVIVMPGRVGLVATDSFALETPIVTTAWPFHSPEFDYLRDGVNARILANDPVQFGQGVVGLLRDSSELDRLRVGCRQSAQRYTVENMVERFSEGALAALEAGPRRAVQLSESRRAANTPGGMPLTARSLVKAAVTRVGPLRRRLLTSTDYSVNPIVAGGQAGWASARAVGRQDRAWARIVDAALRGDVRSDVEALWRGLGATDARDLIEIGSGHGHLSELLTYRRPDLSYVGLDISLPMCAMARSRRPELSVVVGDAACLPFLSRSTDAVLDAATLMHVPEWRAALAEEGRVARRWLLLHSVTVADVDEPLRMRKWAYGAPVFEAVLSSTQLTKELARGGFAVVDRLHSLDYDLHEHIGVHTRSETWVCERHMR